jgi:hypothetical protein
MMSPSLYQGDSRKQIHRGAIYQFRPVFWLEPPLYILRDIQWESPRHAGLYLQNELHNQFRVADSRNEECVVAQAKVRSVIVLSHDYEASDPNVEDLVIAPVYTLKPDKMARETLDRFRGNHFPASFYLPHDPRFSELPEGYVSYRNIRPLKRGFLRAEKKCHFSLAPLAMKALLERYHHYLSIVD